MESRKATRRDFMKIAGRGVAAGIAASAVRGPLQAAGKRPNFVWLMTEDNSKHYMKLYDEKGAATPRIAELAREGVVFNHAFSNCPVCSAARSTLETGCYGARIGTQFHRKYKTVPLPGDLRMFPVYLQRAGYYTSNKKKTDYNFRAGKGGWNSSKDWRGRKSGQPFFHKQSFGTTHEGKLHKVRVGGALSEKEKRTFIHPYFPDTPLFRRTAATYHSLHRKMDGEIGRVVDQLKKDGVLEDTFVFYFGAHGGVLPRGKGYVYETGLHVPLVLRIPENFRRLVDLKRGTRVDGFVSFVDFGPTVLHMAGIKLPDEVDGRPFMGPGISLADLNARDETFGTADRFDEKYDMVRSLRKGRYKYIRSYQPFNFDSLQNNYRYKMAAYREWRDLYKAGKLNKVQSQFHEARTPDALYDIEKDPYETVNLASVPAHAATLADMRRRLAEKVKGLPDLSFYPESYLADRAFGNPVGFGQKHKKEIARLVDIADLSLIPFADAKSGIEAALGSAKPWERYWGLIACSSFGKQALSFADKAKEMAKGDSELLVRVRAAEFLGLTGAADPRPAIMDVLARARHPLEVLLTLNTVVLLRDGKPGYEFRITKDAVKTKQGEVGRRLGYLAQR
ncbi:MAG: sulfatase family protein [Planctomycetota bacterium]|jgi:arylsulfatase A-like enzyme